MMPQRDLKVLHAAVGVSDCISVLISSFPVLHTVTAGCLQSQLSYKRGFGKCEQCIGQHYFLTSADESDYEAILFHTELMNILQDICMH